MLTEFYKYIYSANWRDKNNPIRICLLETGLVKYIEDEIGVMKISDVQEFA